MNHILLKGSGVRNLAVRPRLPVEPLPRMDTGGLAINICQSKSLNYACLWPPKNPHARPAMPEAGSTKTMILAARKQYQKHGPRARDSALKMRVNSKISKKEYQCTRGGHYGI